MTLKKTLADKRKIIMILLCIIALTGFILPAVYVEIPLLEYSSNINVLNVFSLFDNSDTQFGGTVLSGIDVSELADSKMSADTTLKLTLLVSSYFITIILLMITLICTFVGKLKKTSNVMLAVSFILFIYAGYAISKLTEVLAGEFGKNLGFIASFIKIPDMIEIHLEAGYWITITAIGCMLLVNVVAYIKHLIQKRKPIQTDIVI